jgi:hypothetical protein
MFTLTKRKEIEQLLAHVRDVVTDDLFIYADYFDSAGAWAACMTGQLTPWAAVHPCGTAACLAGHACLLFKLEPGKDCCISSVVAAFLELPEAIADDLFITQAGRANRADAVLRLEHLLREERMNNYDWTKESWYQN